MHRTFRLDQPHGVIHGDLRIPDGPPPRTAVVVVHGFKGYKDWAFFPWVAESLVADRHAVVSFNLTGSGIGSGVGSDPHKFTDLEAFGANTYSREVSDVLAVLDAVRGDLLTRPPARIGILGHSRGGADAILAADRVANQEGNSGAVDALVTWSAVSDLYRWTAETVETWREQGRIYVLNSRTGQQMPLDLTLLEDLEENAEALDVTAAAARIACPWLVVHGTGDATVDVENARALVSAAKGARLHLVDGAGHTYEVGHPFPGPSDQLQNAMRATRQHLRTALRPD